MTSEVVNRVESLRGICEERRWTVALAESCTGGLLSSWISSQPGVSKFFQGAVVSYARAVKEKSLGIPRTLLQAHGEVSLPTALAMARGARLGLDSDWGLSITGIAGPSGGTAVKPVGFVCFGLVGPGFENSHHHQFAAHGGRQDIQRQAALFAFDLLLNAMR